MAMHKKAGLAPRRVLMASAAAAALGMLSATAHAAAPAAPDTGGQVDELVVTGSRFGPRVVTDSPTPIDSISKEELAKSGATDVQGMIKVAVPSFSTPRPSAAGVLDFLTPPTLRGLSTGQLLMLVNGKRRHTSADLNTGVQIGRGDVSYDFNSIPAAAIGRVEVLRDGAAAQYGSDAIAGVINVQLDRSRGVLGQLRYGETSKGDGQDTQVALGQGFALGSGGFVRVTGSYQDHDHTNRALPDTRQQYFGLSPTGSLVLPSGSYGSGVGLTPSNGALDPRESTIDRNMWVFGEPDYRNGSVFLNSELPLAKDITAYAFGGYNQLKGTTYNFFRRAGQDETVRALHPDGYLPFQLTTMENYSIAAGLKGDDLVGFHWDLSTVYGGSENRYSYTNTNNVSLGATSPTSFDIGGARFRQWTTDLDLTREIPVGDSEPLKLALGVEYRREFYDLLAGEPLSFANGGVPILDGPNAGKPAPVGSQPGPGASPANAIHGERDSKAIYAELEKTFADRLTISAAVRHEDFSDFGTTTDYKVAGRYEIVEGFAVRGSYGTGFRAPALAQSFFGQTNSNFINGQQVKVQIVSVHEAMAPLVGAQPLKPETSKNLSLGAVFRRGDLSATIDAYRIEIQDRIAISSNFSSAALTGYLAGQGFPGVATVAYLTNAVDTTTRGLDITARYRRDLGDLGALTTTLAANFNETKFDRIAGTPPALAALGITTPLFDLTQQVRFSDSMPKSKVTLNFNWAHDKWAVNLTGTRYGEVAQVALTNRNPAQVAALIPGYDVKLVPSAPGSANMDIIQKFRADIVTDLDVAYAMTEHLTLSAGAANLFDIYPERQIASTVASVAAGANGADNNGIFPYAYIAPYGTSGRFVYVRAAYRF
jgi:iron complex outermembrane receptor protein